MRLVVNEELNWSSRYGVVCEFETNEFHFTKSVVVYMVIQCAFWSTWTSLAAMVESDRFRAEYIWLLEFDSLRHIPYKLFFPSIPAISAWATGIWWHKLPPVHRLSNRNYLNRNGRVRHCAPCNVSWSRGKQFLPQGTRDCVVKKGYAYHYPYYASVSRAPGKSVTKDHTSLSYRPCASSFTFIFFTFIASLAGVLDKGTSFRGRCKSLYRIQAEYWASIF